MNPNHISMQALHGALKSLGPKEVVLDVRGREEFAEGHVPGALNIPHDEVGSRVAALRAYDRIYLHCRSGKRAQLALAELQSRGFANVVCVSDGGMADWIAAGYEIAKGA